MTLFIIITCLFILTLTLLFVSIFADWDEPVCLIILMLLIIFGVGMIAAAAHAKPNIKPIEYPASEYTFKIKVVEFEEQRDTILVVTPKEK